MWINFTPDITSYNAHCQAEYPAIATVHVQPKYLHTGSLLNKNISKLGNVNLQFCDQLLLKTNLILYLVPLEERK